MTGYSYNETMIHFKIIIKILDNTLTLFFMFTLLKCLKVDLKLNEIYTLGTLESSFVIDTANWYLLNVIHTCVCLYFYFVYL